MIDTTKLEKLAATIRPIKQRIAILPIEEEATGIILIPTNANQLHKLGVIVAVGDGVTIDAKVGQIVLYQVNRMFEASVTHFIDETAVMVMHQGDAIARLEGRQITLEKFTVLGDWVLASDVKIDQLGGIFLPDSAIPPPEFIVNQIGNTVATSDDPVLVEMKVADKIYIDKSRSNKISIQGKQFFYVLKHGIQAVRIEEPLLNLVDGQVSLKKKKTK